MSPQSQHVETVDISALFGPPGKAREACDAALWQGLKRTGAVVITGYPDAAKVDQRARTGLKIFDLSDTAKRAIASRVMVPGNPNTYRGFWPRRETGLLQNEFYDVGPETPAPGPDLPQMDIFTEATPWPDPEPAPGWRETVRAHYAHLNRVAQAMIVSIGRSAGFDEAAIRARFDGDHSTLRFLSYPAGATSPRQEPDGAVVSGGQHTDESGLSLLWQAQPGLQARGQDGVFRDIPMVENAISVHVGGVMTGLTRGTVPATPHRVLAGDGSARQSVGFFLEPALSAPVTPADYSGETSARETYGWQLLDTFSKRDIWKGVVHPPESAD
ncbi:isopenicillin N synthase family oxygenase [Aliishimia ponticola]|uniref:2-oxoglutarate-dependent ethylene/succinate-forming enzyme n=1 Tax=Aliishimia ponticola TaxID=2499833 RepID=A0A4S4NBL7_9RHOB|nr:2OG-Fe(II) oxygenase family protein [Aliishimia ponticola]THH36792.1 isopenicillin N synthase family oxygenase [Aliishimia ponticola]